MRNERRLSLKAVVLSLLTIFIIVIVSFGICAAIAVYQFVPYHGEYKIRAETDASGPYTLTLPVIINSMGAPIKDVLKTHLDKNITSISFTNTQYGPALEINASGNFFFSYSKNSKNRAIFANISLMGTNSSNIHIFHVYYNTSKNISIKVDLSCKSYQDGLIIGGRIFQGSMSSTLPKGWNEIRAKIKTTMID